MFKRTLENILREVSQKFPVITLTGPRQSGKTTLIKSTFSNYAYVSLEDIDNRQFAIEDPRGFLATYKNGVIIDEAQNAPQLFSYIQTHVDQSQKMGEFILTGSQQLLLAEKISQSLAGRACVLQLLPCSAGELSIDSSANLWDVLQKGFYPAIYDRSIEPTQYYKSYVNTYIERDVRSLSGIKDLSKFKTFLQLCAGRVGQLLNMSSLGGDCGIDQATVKSWISILEASYLVFLTRPHHQNFSKRLMKQPKLYFYDTGLLSYLLGIESPKELEIHFARGALFENYVALELLKERYHHGKEANLFFWRDHHGHEVDFICEQSSLLKAIEVKSSQTITSDFFKGLHYWKNLAGEKNPCFLVYAGNESQNRSDASVLPWTKVKTIQTHES